MNALLLFIFLSFKMVSSNKTLGTVGKMQLMTAKMFNSHYWMLKKKLFKIMNFIINQF